MPGMSSVPVLQRQDIRKREKWVANIEDDQRVSVVRAGCVVASPFASSEQYVADSLSSRQGRRGARAVKM